MKISVKLDDFYIKKIINRLIYTDDVGIFMAETCARYMDKYIPMDTGMLAQNYETKPFYVTYNQPYAHRLFEGDGLNLNKEKHPLATSHWNEACYNAKKNEIAKEVQAFVERTC